jgi:hypothetical protein
MAHDDSQLLFSHLRRTIRNFALYEAVATGAITTTELARRLGVPVASLQVKLLRARDSARKYLRDNELTAFLEEKVFQEEVLE